ncbi:MAG: TrkA C-terminal domain-containing protein, partial [Candidatus Methanomethylophilus sp.]|nr:TrkA C-terminal domain-containing protein [Methanomethylophilus sp.]
QANPADVARVVVISRLQASIMDIAGAAEHIADVVLRGLAEHPVLAMSIRDADTTICLAKVAPDSVLAGKTFGEISLSTRCGMFVIAIRRDKDYIFGPGRNNRMEAGDILIARGPEEGEGYFKDLADGTEKEL